MSKKAKELYLQIVQGHGVNRDKFPEKSKGELAKKLWNDDVFTLGLEYGILYALNELFTLEALDE